MMSAAAQPETYSLAPASSVRRDMAEARGASARRSATLPTPGKPPKHDSSEALEAALNQLGPFGFYQKYLLVMLCVPNLLAVMYQFNYVFVANQVPFRCVVPECEAGVSEFNNETVSALLPADGCRRYVPLEGISEGSCSREHYHPNDTIPCETFIYETGNSIYAEFDLGCREWMRTLVGTVRNSALPFALLLTGYVSDTWGRRSAFCIFATFAGVMGIVKAFAVNYYMYLVLEFFEAALGYGFTSAAYVMMVEIAHPSLRAIFACATGLVYGLGGMLFAWIAWGIPYWRHLLWTIHSLALLLPMYWLLIDESPRWLHAQGNIEKTSHIIRKAARWNKICVDEDLMKKLNDSTKHGSVEVPKSRWLSMVKSRVLMVRFAVCGWCWVASAFVYYGLTINSVSLSGDMYVNFALNMSMEIAASLLIMMALDRIGRKLCIFIAFLLCGVACVSPFFTAHANTVTALFFVGKMSITFAFNSLYVFTAELFPTRSRSSAMAACSLVGRLGSILAPQTPLLNAYVQAALYGACSLLAALAVLLMPETRQARLPQGVEDAEHIRPADVTTVLAAPAPRSPRILSANT